MARNFNGTTQRLVNVTGVPVSVAPLTVSAWVNPSTAAPLDDMVIISLCRTDSAQHWFRLLIEGNTIADRGYPRWAVTAGGVAGKAQATSLILANTWQHLCGVEYSSSNRSVFLNAGSQGSNFDLRVPAGVNRIDIAHCNWIGNPDWFSGSIAHVAIWNVALLTNEIKALSSGLSPLQIRPDKLVAYYPLNGRPTEPDVVRKLNLTVVNAPLVVTEPKNLLGKFIIAA